MCVVDGGLGFLVLWVIMVDFGWFWVFLDDD